MYIHIHISLYTFVYEQSLRRHREHTGMGSSISAISSCVISVNVPGVYCASS